MGIRSKISIILIVAIALTLTTVFGFVIYNDITNGDEAFVENGKLIVRGQYSDEIDLASADVSLVSDQLNVAMRIAGKTNSNDMSGKFSIMGYDSAAYCSVQNKGGSVIRIQTEDKLIFVNLANDEATLDLYEKIMDVKNA